jgi:hypothetical protein
MYVSLEETFLTLAPEAEWSPLCCDCLWYPLDGIQNETQYQFEESGGQNSSNTSTGNYNLAAQSVTCYFND